MSGALIIENGVLIDGTGAEPVPGSSVLMRGDEILAVGPVAEVAALAPVDVERFDAAGSTIMPGLIDSHCHITFDDVQSNDELFFHRPAVSSALVTGFNLKKLLLAGVTGFMDPDTVHGIGPEVRDAIEAGVIEGPRMATGVQALLTAVGGTAGRLIPDEGAVGYAKVVNTTDEMVTAVRQQIKHGADWIKVHATGSIPRHSGELQVWTLEEMKVVCDTAHALGVPVVAHCRSASSTRDAARAGVDLILHASFIDEEALQAVIDAGAALCPTFTFLANLADYGAKVGAGLGMTDVFKGEIKATAEMMREAFDAGVPLLCGSESGFALTPYGHWHARELEVFVEEMGLTPLEAITCATKNSAIAIRLEGKVGVLKVGMLADVLVVDGDPSKDVRVLQERTRLKAVISRGRSVNLSQPWPSRGRIPGEKVGNWSSEALTYEKAIGLS